MQQEKQTKKNTRRGSVQIFDKDIKYWSKSHRTEIVC